MSKPISIVMPVHNAAAELNRRMQRVLEILPDFASQFEVHIVDDASSDATVEVADELAREYPQVQVSRNGRRLGVERTVQRTARRLGRPVLVIDSEHALPSLADFTRLHKGIAKPSELA